MKKFKKTFQKYIHTYHITHTHTTLHTDIPHFTQTHIPHYVYIHYAYITDIPNHLDTQDFDTQQS